MSFEDLFDDQRIMVILRGRPPGETVALAGRAWDAGITPVEVPIGRPEQVAALAAAVRAGAERGRPVGAGTGSVIGSGSGWSGLALVMP
ncbi:hypothetical protein ACQEUX_12265 [Micromonospora sp. CA-259024]|uniref:hypothetical protein n=1 Tax=Micromonospora sp. CA-259024 TaxID=3239965 RepID=UPI003D931B0A